MWTRNKGFWTAYQMKAAVDVDTPELNSETHEIQQHIMSHVYTFTTAIRPCYTESTLHYYLIGQSQCIMLYTANNLSIRMQQPIFDEL